MIDSRKFEFPEDLLEEDEFGRLVSFSKSLSDSLFDINVGSGIFSNESLPQNFGSYQLTRLIREHSIGSSFLAKLSTSPKEFVVTKIQSKLVRNFSLDKFEHLMQQFRQESTTAVSIAPELFIPLVEIGDVDGKFFFSAEHVKGKGLAKLINANTFSNRQSAETVNFLAKSIEKLHRSGILLSHFGPENIILDKHQQPHFQNAFAHLLMGEDDKCKESPFTAPEISETKNSTVAAEVWTIGAILYNCLLGEPPEIQNGAKIPSLRKRNPKVARDLETICLKCLGHNPASRYRSMADLIDDLELFLDYQPINAVPPSLKGKLAAKISRMG